MSFDISYQQVMGDWLTTGLENKFRKVYYPTETQLLLTRLFIYVHDSGNNKGNLWHYITKPNKETQLCETAVGKKRAGQ